MSEQRRKSGWKKWANGLAEEEKAYQQAKAKAYKDYNIGRDLNDRLQMAMGSNGTSKDKGKDKGKGKAKGKGKHSSRLAPLSWDRMDWKQRWYVKHFRNGNLSRWLWAAQNAYHPRSADTPYFKIDE